jgi:hypothetical protein
MPSVAAGQRATTAPAGKKRWNCPLVNRMPTRPAKMAQKINYKTLKIGLKKA